MTLVRTKPSSLESRLSSTKLHELLESFLTGRNERTLQAYRRDLSDFCAFVGVKTADEAARLLFSHGLGDANSVGLRYRASMVERGLSPATVNRRLSALRSLVKLARTTGLVPWELEVPSMKSQAYRDTRGPGKDSVLRLFEELRKSETPKARRDLALFRLLYDRGLRRGEVVSLDVGDVDLEAGTVRVLGKGRTEHESFSIPEKTREALREWLSVRGSKPGPLFVNYDRAGKGGRLTGRSLDRALKAWGSKIGLRLRPHGLRHSAITEALELTNGNVRAVRKFSRHKDVRVLMAYDDNREDLGGDVACLVAGTA